MDRTGSDRGFTLIEMMLVLGILAIVLALGIASFRYAVGARELEAAANELVGTLQYGRATARGGTPVTATFTSSSWRVSTALATPLRTVSLPSSVTVAMPQALAVLVFNPNGSASASGTYTLTSSQTGRTATVTVAASTGSSVLRLP